MNIRRLSQIVFMLLMLLVSGAKVTLAADVTTNDITINVTNPNKGSFTVSVGALGASTAGCYRVTLTATFTAGYGISTSDITVQPLVEASTRTTNPGIANNLTVTGSGTTFYFDLPERYHGALVTATFMEKELKGISSLNDITDPNGNYVFNSGFSATGTPKVNGNGAEIGTSGNPFRGKIDGNFVEISNGPLFDCIEGAVIKNVLFDNVSISANSNGNAGAVCCEAKGASRIYNCGVLATNSTVEKDDDGYDKITNYGSSINGSNYVGSIVGLLEGSSRVINCFSYAEIQGGSYRGGIVGYNNVSTNTPATSLKTMVMNCMFYGNITGGSIAPIYNGYNITNVGNAGVSNFNYFWGGASYVRSINVYNCALLAETRFLQRFEFFRHLLNSHRELAAWWATGESSNKDEMAKWVLEPSQIGSTTPFPVLKTPKDANGKYIQYPSVVNIDAKNATTQTERNKGGKLGTLTVNIRMGDGAVFTHPGTGDNEAKITTSQLTLNITDKDPDHFNFNYYKVQLPYYNDVGTKNYTGNRVVTGWKIVSVDDGGTEGTFTTGADAETNAKGEITATPYNFADRKSYAKDLYSKSGRIFNQGAYWDVPEGVKEITIEPYWAKAVYLADANADVVYSTNMKTAYPVPNVGGGTLYTNGVSTFNGQLVYTAITGAGNAIDSSVLGANTSNTVYDYAVVLVGNFHYYEGSIEASKPYTVTTVDLDGDHEPDYSFMLRFDGRNVLHPVRYDFLNLVGLGMAQKSTGGTGTYNLGIFVPKGWFESTNTSLFQFTQFEYEHGSRTDKDPLILQGGVIEQWVSFSQNGSSNKTPYYHVGGNVWFKEFHRGCHQEKPKATKHTPLSVTGGDYNEFYLTGLYTDSGSNIEDDAECYINGGRFGIVAGAAIEGIGNTSTHANGNIVWQIQNADIKEFYGGGINAAHPVEGNITTVVEGGYIKQFCGGPKFGDMNSGKTVKTTATGCKFDTYFGAGYGGNSYNRYAPTNINNIDGDYGTTNWNTFVNNNYKQGYSDKYKGVSVTYFSQYLPMSNNYQNVARILIDYVSFSLAKTHDVTSKLIGCTITGNFYGGGSFGKVAGPVTSTLENCTVNGSVYGAGFSASLPTVEVMNTGGFDTAPFYDKDLGVYMEPTYPATVTYHWEHAATVNSTATAINKTSYTLYTTEDVDALGTVEGKVTLNIEGTTSITGSVYGGGQSSDVYGKNSSDVVTSEVEVNVNGGSVTDVYGGGEGETTVVGGDVTVNIGKLKENSTTEYEGTATVNGNVYGGSALGVVNAKKDDDWDKETNPFDFLAVDGKETKVNLLKGTVNGSVYGGGLGQQDVVNANNEVTTPGIAANVFGPVTVTVEGGTAQNVYGCNNLNGTPKSTVEVFINGTAASSGTGTDKTYALQGVYGGGNLAHYDPTTPGEYPTVTVNGCSTSIKDVFGGGNAAAVPYTKVTINGGDIDRVFAGGNGSSGAANVGYKNSKVTPAAGEDEYGTGTSNATIAGGTINEIYGGSNNKGTVRTAGTMSIAKSTAAGACPMKIGSVYGGGNEAPGAAAALTIGCTGTDDDEGITNVFGGANAANVTGNILLTITEGKIANVFGGNNSSGTVSGTITVNINKAASPCVWDIGNVFGGGKDAAYSAPSESLNYPEVNIKNGTVGNVFGGGQGSGATVTGNPQVTIGDATAANSVAIVSGDVYGGGDAAAVTGTPVVHVINKNNTNIGNVYGGGNAADVSATSVTIDGGTIGMVFGGGHGDKNSDPQKEANVTGGVSVTVTGGTITKVFGGSNSKGNIDGTIALGITKAADASTMKIGEVYGGGNEAAGNAGTITIGCTGTLVALGEGEQYGYQQEGIGYVYGGANNADVGNDITLNITGGIVANVFGGNNTGGNISGSITVNIEKDASAACVDNWYVGNVYGGGNVASYRPTTVGAYPEVNIKNGTVSGSVFGGGLGATAKVCSNPKVTIGDISEGHDSYEAIVTGDVYGGGSAAMVGDDTEGKTSTNNTTVLIQKANSSVANVFGGGMAASVTGTTSVTIAGGTVSTGVYGGCNTSGSVGNVTIALNGGTVGANTDNTTRADVYGGGLGSSTTTTGNIGITLGTDATTGTTVYGDIYGGSALGYVNASASNTSTVTLTSATLYGSVFGGGKGQNTPSEVTATSNGGATVNVNVANTHLTGIYGGANVRGNVKGAIIVNVNANVGADGSGNSLSIFGGGYGANTKTEGNVTVNIGDAAGTYQPVIYGDIYGGSALGNVNKDSNNTTTVNFLNGTLHGNLYGGGLGDATNAAKVNGKVEVNIGTSTQTDAQCHIDLSETSIYGCNNTNGSPQDNVTVNIYKTAHTEKNTASYTGTDATYAIDQVFGGGNQANYAPENGSTSSTKKTSVHVYGCDNTIRRVFGGGNAAAAVGVVTEIYSGRFDYVYGGGNGEVTAANIGAGGTNLQIHGGKINNLFGGSNEQGTISGNMGVTVDNDCDCEQSGTSTYVDEFFCGNNLASIGTPENPVNITATIACGTRFGAVYGGCSLAPLYGSVNLTVEGGEMNYVYGGSKGDLARLNDELGETGHTDTPANISGNVTLTIKGGKIKNVFGGSNINGNIAGSIEVNIEKNDASTCNDGWYVGNVYGASNLAAYKPTVEGNTLKVNIKNGTVSGNVYGGGKGASATVTSNPVVTIGDVTNENYKAIIADDANDKDVNNAAFVGGNVYGGGDAAPVVGNTTVTYNDNNANTSVANIYGGGNNASVSGNATVTLKGKATVEHDVFGGGNEGIVVGTAKVNIEE